MSSTIKIGVIGDYDGRPSHIATSEAIGHYALHLGLKQETHWIASDSFKDSSERNLNSFDALWCAPGTLIKAQRNLDTNKRNVDKFQYVELLRILHILCRR